MSSLKFVDLFAGCGGLSLGFSQAGLEGVFAIERDSMAFATFEANFLGNYGKCNKFTWPDWLEQKAWDIAILLEEHRDKLLSLRGQVDILCGGPPCQGFSLAGRRNEDDPRNQLFNQYVEVAQALRPQAIVLENVPGMKALHGRGNIVRFGGNGARKIRQSYYEKLVSRLQDAGYEVASAIVDCSRFGVPQRRSRLIAVGMRKDALHQFPDFGKRAFELLEDSRVQMLRELGLTDKVSASDAISDLETRGKHLGPCRDPLLRGDFYEVEYAHPKTPYQILMQDGCDRPMDSMRLARHRPHVAARFERIINECRKGVPMSEASRREFGLKKQRIHPMSSEDPSPTVTTLPDDILHYSEPRILTVRETARLQSFPDWFQFKGKYTTGGQRRRKECPRYTQVGNAVPPLLARAIGVAVTRLLQEAQCTASQDESEFLHEEAELRHVST